MPLINNTLEPYANPQSTLEPHASNSHSTLELHAGNPQSTIEPHAGSTIDI